MYPSRTHKLLVDVMGIEGLVSEIIEFLMYGADTPFEIAHRNNVMEISRGSKFYGISMLGACVGGHLELVRYYMELGHDHMSWGRGFLYACRHGHLDIAKLMVHKGASNLNWGVTEACAGGHIDVVKYLISMNPREIYRSINNGLYAASSAGHLELVKLMLEHSADNISNAYRVAKSMKHTHIVDFLGKRVMG